MQVDAFIQPLVRYYRVYCAQNSLTIIEIVYSLNPGLKMANSSCANPTFPVAEIVAPSSHYPHLMCAFSATDSTLTNSFAAAAHFIVPYFNMRRSLYSTLG